MNELKEAIKNMIATMKLQVKRGNSDSAFLLRRL